VLNEEKRERRRTPFSMYYDATKLLRFRLPEVEDKEIVVLRLKDKRVVARTAEEIEKLGITK